MWWVESRGSLWSLLILESSVVAISDCGEARAEVDHLKETIYSILGRDIGGLNQGRSSGNGFYIDVEGEPDHTDKEANGKKIV